MSKHQFQDQFFEVQEQRSFNTHRRKCEKKAHQCSSDSFQEQPAKPPELRAQSIPESHHMDESEENAEMKFRFEPVQYEADPVAYKLWDLKDSWNHNTVNHDGLLKIL